MAPTAGSDSGGSSLRITTSSGASVPPYIGIDGESPRVGLPPEVITNISARSADDPVLKWNDTSRPGWKLNQC